MSTIWMVLGGCLIGVGVFIFLITVLLEQTAVKKLQEKYKQL